MVSFSTKVWVSHNSSVVVCNKVEFECRLVWQKSGASSRNNCTLVKQAASGNMTCCCCCCCIVYHLINCICLSFLCVVNLMWTLAIRCWNPCEIGKLNSLTFTLYFMHIVETDTFIYTAQYTYRCQVCSFCWWEEVQYLLIAAVNSVIAFVVLFM